MQKGVYGGWVDSGYGKIPYLSHVFLHVLWGLSSLCGSYCHCHSPREDEGQIGFGWDRNLVVAITRGGGGG